MPVNIPELLSAERSLGVFFLVTVLMGGGAAWLAGRACAATWRPPWQMALYMLILALWSTPRSACCLDGSASG